MGDPGRNDSDRSRIKGGGVGGHCCSLDALDDEGDPDRTEDPHTLSFVGR
jgi:hypothetical protein